MRYQLNFEERLYRRLKELGRDIKEEEIRGIVADLKRWVVSPSEDRVVKTEDGSYTLFSGKYGEPFHSVTAGAVREALEKFVKPSGVLNMDEADLLDIGFGLGYNVAVVIYFTLKERKRLNVVSLEKELPDRFILLPPPFREVHRKLLDMLPEGEMEGISFKLLKGDARETVREIRDFKADVVFHDPFSPFRNPELWTLDFLREVKGRMKERGVWVTYSSSLPVRRALKDLGFKVGKSRPVGRKRGGTVASPSLEVPPLDEEEVVKLNTSPYSVPFRDPFLKDDPVDILLNYRIEVALRKAEIRNLGRPLK